MKEHITKEQWNELTDDDKKKAIKIFTKWNDFDYIWITIGRMIEFLGDDIVNMSLNGVEGDNKKYWFVMLKNWRSAGYKDLHNALWIAVKYKLQK